MVRNRPQRNVNARFPPELVDQVIQNIDAADTRTLCNLGLVSRTWRALSGEILFSSVVIHLGHEKLLRNLNHTTFRPYVREITLKMSPSDPWIKRRLPKILAQLPAFKTLRLTHIGANFGMHLLPVFPALTHLTLAFDHPPAGDFGLPAMLHLACSFPLLEIFQLTTEAEYNFTGPFNFPERTTLEPLAHLRTIHLDYPMLNARILAFIAPPALATLHLNLRSDSDSLHACLSAAGPALRVLALSFPHDPPRDMRIGRLMTPPLPTELRTLRLLAPVPCHSLIDITAHLLERVIAAPHLEELILEVKEIDGSVEEAVDDGERMDGSRAALGHVLETLPAFRTLRMPHLGTNCVPTASERKEIQEYCAEGKEGLVRLAEVVERDSLRLESSSDRLTRMHELLDPFIALLSPIRAIPPEILREIFPACLPTRHDAIMHASHMPLALGCVCGGWRTISLSTPALWSSVHVVVPSADGEQGRGELLLACESLKLWLLRSENCLL
ncbi:hypothetical protein B0H19DRAFT_1381603 [Mycena capillaripes]|nr:hypothetical protein B0H19DRAFT_1381603 [Mycena capillaripes]